MDPHRTNDDSKNDQLAPTEIEDGVALAARMPFFARFLERPMRVRTSIRAGKKPPPSDDHPA